MIKSWNNKIITEVYNGSAAPKKQERPGFVGVQQKTSVVKLKVLFDAEILIGTSQTLLKAGAYAIFWENDIAMLHEAKYPISINNMQCIVVPFEKCIAIEG